MRKIAVPVLLAGLVGLATPPASATLVAPPPLVVTRAVPVGGTTFQGGCGFVAVNDTTPGGLQGGANAHNGVVFMAVATLAGSPATVQCQLKVNTVVVAGNPVLGPTTGNDVVVDARTFRYIAAPGSVVEMCTIVTIGSLTQTSCVTAADTPVVPTPVYDLLVATLNTVLALVDPVLCNVLVTVRPIVNPLLAPTIDLAADGDVFVNGAKVYDCPPYGA